MSGSKASNSKTLLIVAQEVPMILRTNCLAIAKVIIRLQIYTHIHTHSNRLSNTFYIFDIDGGTILNESNSVKKLLHVESKKNNLFTEEVESNHEYSVKKDNNVSSQLTETDLKESYGKE